MDTCDSPNISHEQNSDVEGGAKVHLTLLDDDDVYLRLQYGKGFHNLVYTSYINHINPAKRHKL
jgi:hypothetical protein